MKLYEERREVLLKQFSFPCRIVMYLQKKERGYTVLVSNFRNKKKKLESVRFAELQAFSFGGCMTPISINEFENVDDLINAIEIEAGQWLDAEVQE